MAKLKKGVRKGGASSSKEEASTSKDEVDEEHSEEGVEEGVDEAQALEKENDLATKAEEASIAGMDLDEIPSKIPVDEDTASDKKEIKIERESTISRSKTNESGDKVEATELVELPVMKGKGKKGKGKKKKKVVDEGESVRESSSASLKKGDKLKELTTDEFTDNTLIQEPQKITKSSKKAEEIELEPMGLQIAEKDSEEKNVVEPKDVNGNVEEKAADDKVEKESIRRKPTLSELRESSLDAENAENNEVNCI